MVIEENNINYYKTSMLKNHVRQRNKDINCPYERFLLHQKMQKNHATTQISTKINILDK